ncbi:MAG: hypothetical protein QM499_00930 [Flavobacteriaceae bacterium]
MPQNTTAAAYTRLKPLVNNNLGAIVQEHIRYYTKRKDDKEAQQSALSAQAAKLQLSKNKFSKSIYEGMIPDVSQGYIASQTIDAFDSKSDLIQDLAQRFTDGDTEAGRQLSDLERKFDNLSAVSNLWGAKAIELSKDEANYNKWLDKDIKNTTEAVGKGLYNINKETLGFNIVDLDTGETRELTNGELRSNDYLTAKYSGKPNFLKNGELVVKNLLDNIKGVKKSNKQTKIDGMSLIEGVFAKDNIEARSFYAMIRQGVVLGKDGKPIEFKDKDGNQIPLGDLKDKPILMNKLTGAYYDKFVYPNLVKVIPKPPSTGSGRKSTKKPPAINITANESGVVLTTDPLINDPAVKKTASKNTESYNVTGISRKIGNGTQTIDKLFYNKDTGVVSVQVSLYEPVEVTTSSTDQETGKPITYTEQLGKKVNTRVISGDEDVSEIGNVMNVNDAEGVLNLINEKRAEHQARQDAKKGKSKNPSKKTELTEEEMKAFLGN